MKRFGLEGLLLGLGLGGGTRIDLLNLAQNRAVNIWPHRVMAAVTALIIGLLATGMARQWRGMQSHRPSPGSTLAKLRADLDQTQQQITGQKQKFDPKEAQALGAQVREANMLITQRAFKPTELLGDLEAVKPFAARLLGLRRGPDRGGAMQLDFHLKSPTRKTYEAFASRIGRAHRFSNLELRSESYQNGEFEAEIVMLWTPAGAPESTELPPGAEKAVIRGNGAGVPLNPAAVNRAAPAARPENRPAAPAKPHAGRPPRKNPGGAR